jgi:hypothetical protein
MICKHKKSYHETNDQVDGKPVMKITIDYQSYCLKSKFLRIYLGIDLGFAGYTLH